MSVLSLVGGSQSFSSTSGGKITAINNLTTAVVTVIAANPSRQKITFHNPGNVDVFICPAVLANGQAFNPTGLGLGGSFRVFANGGTLTIEGECQIAWQAFAESGTGKALTIMESNI